MPTPTIGEPGIERSVASVTVCVGGGCPRFKRKTTWAITPNSVHIYSMAGPRHALTRRSKGQGHSHGYENRHSHAVACEACRFSAASAGLHVVRLLKFLVSLSNYTVWLSPCPIARDRQYTGCRDCWMPWRQSVGMTDAHILTSDGCAVQSGPKKVSCCIMGCNVVN